MKTPAGAVERRLRIALLVDRFGNRFGGAEAYGVELMRVLGQRHDVSIVARDFDSDLPFPFLPVRFPGWLPSWMRVLYFAWRADRLTRGRYDIVHSHMNGWAGEIQVMHVTPVRYNRLTRVKPLQRLTAWLSPRPATYLLLEKLRVRQAPARRVVAVSGLIMDQLHRSYGPQLPVDIIAPAVRQLNDEGLPVQGPFPADTIFLKAQAGEFQAIVTMYHDQGQIAIKLLGFSRGVTVQGGLPIPITTPAHGTAYDIAGQGRANLDATWQAFLIACRMGLSHRASRTRAG
ncbi:hypothetical protein DAI43_35160 [Achromobacter xylosoxidans]|nr:hypothetical protein DAI43_35160 [Achromobacter xylosoxidans]